MYTCQPQLNSKHLIQEKNKVKKIILFMVLSLSMICLSVAAVSAGDGNYRKGKYSFRKSCRTCHSDSGTAESLSPDSKTQAQWKRVFKPNKYKKLECAAEWEKLSEKDRNNIFSYLHKYAFDSPTPAKCK
ncbi:MAG: cytochrome c [Desulfobacter sp.]|nr:MAG: cytochrome c [Desulfobacter sp.]